MAWVSLVRSYQMLRSGKLTTFTVFELFWNNQQGEVNVFVLKLMLQHKALRNVFLDLTDKGEEIVLIIMRHFASPQY